MDAPSSVPTGAWLACNCKLPDGKTGAMGSSGCNTWWLQGGWRGQGNRLGPTTFSAGVPVTGWLVCAGSSCVGHKKADKSLRPRRTQLRFRRWLHSSTGDDGSGAGDISLSGTLSAARNRLVTGCSYWSKDINCVFINGIVKSQQSRVPCCQRQNRKCALCVSNVKSSGRCT